MHRCAHCGATASAGATHCGSCGARVAGAPDPRSGLGRGGDLFSTVPGAGSDVIRLEEGRTVPEGALAQAAAEAARASGGGQVAGRSSSVDLLDPDAPTVREDELGSLARAARARVATLGVENVGASGEADLRGATLGSGAGPGAGLGAGLGVGSADRTVPEPAPAGVERLSSIQVPVREEDGGAARRRGAATVNGRPAPTDEDLRPRGAGVGVGRSAPEEARAPAAAIPSARVAGPVAPSRGALENGEVVDGYRVVQEIGRGGMGRVYRAEHGVTGQTVALKMLLPELADDARLRARFVNEAKVLARLDHPNLVPLLGFLDGQRGAFIVMPYVEGQTLEKIVRAEGRLALARAGDLVRQIAEALQYVHGKGVMHRDLKPSNILVRPDGVLKLMDFGIARAIGAERITRTGMVVGTAEYLAPEQASGQAHDDPRSEIYSLAVLAFEMVTGRPPFAHPKAAEVLMRHVRDRPPPPRTIRRELPAAAEAAILKGLEKDPEARFGDALSFARAFSRGLASVDEPEPAAAAGAGRKGGRGRAASSPAVARVEPEATPALDRPGGASGEADAARGPDTGGGSRADTLPEVPRKSLLFQIVIGVVLGAALAAGAWQLLLALE